MKILKTIFVLAIIGGISTLIYRFRIELGLESEGNVTTNEFTPEKVLAASLMLNNELDKKISSLTTDMAIVQNSNVISVLAGENIPGERVVIIKDGKAYLYDVTNTLHLNLPIGFAKTSVNANGAVSVNVTGKVITDQALVTNSKYYVGAGGAITTIAPVSNILQSVGFAISQSEILLDFSQKIAQ